MGKRWNMLLSCLIVLAVVALYWPSLHNPVFFDDLELFTNNGLNRIFIAGPALDLRWLTYFPTAWIDLFFDDKVFAQRLINVGLHLLTAYLLYTFIRQVSDRAAPHKNNERASMAAALLFLLHPLSVYAAGYLAQRTIIMATLFGLLALNTYFDGLITRKKGYFLFSALFYFCSVFSKEHAVLLPAAALALTPLAVQPTRQIWRELALPFALYMGIAALVIVRALGIVGQAYEPYAEELINLSHLNVSRRELWLLSGMTQATLFFKYLFLAMIPSPEWMSVDMRVPFASNLRQPMYLLGVSAVAAYGVIALHWLFKGGRNSVAGYALLVPLLLFALEFSSIRIQEPFVLYRAYLWIPFLFMLIPVLTNSVSNRFFWVSVLAVAAIFATASTDRLNSFSSGYALWDDAVRKLPEEPLPGAERALSNRCREFLVKRELDAAIADCSRALELNSQFRAAYQNRTFAYARKGNFPAAIKDAQTVIERFPHDPDGYTLLGVMYQGAGDVEKAKANFEIACGRQALSGCLRLELMNKSTNSGK